MAESLAPCYFMSHGGPGGFLHPEGEPVFKALWKDEIGSTLRDVKGIIWFSAHWYAWRSGAKDSVTFTSNGEVIHDFGEFFDGVFDITFKGKQFSPEQKQLLTKELGLVEDGRGLDHGAWIPMRVMGLEDVPVAQVRLPVEDPVALAELGRKFQSLRRQGYAIMASGGSVHNLQHSFSRMGRNRNAIVGMYKPSDVKTSEWAQEFTDHLSATVEDELKADDGSDVQALAQRVWNRLVKRKDVLKPAHPTVEHLLPLFVAIGAATGPSVQRVIDAFSIADLGMHAYRFE